MLAVINLLERAESEPKHRASDRGASESYRLCYWFLSGDTCIYVTEIIHYLH